MSSDPASPAGAKKSKKNAAAQEPAKKPTDSGDEVTKNKKKSDGVKVPPPEGQDGEVKKPKTKGQRDENGHAEGSAKSGGLKSSNKKQRTPSDDEESDDSSDEPAKATKKHSHAKLATAPVTAHDGKKKNAPAPQKSSEEESESDEAEDHSSDATPSSEEDKKPAPKASNKKPKKPEAEENEEADDESTSESPEPSNSTEETQLVSTASSDKPKVRNDKPSKPNASPSQERAKDTKEKDKKKSGGFLASIFGGKSSKKPAAAGKDEAKPSKGDGAVAAGSAGRDAAEPEKKEPRKGDRVDVTPRDDKKGDEKKTYVASCVAELPEEWQKKLRRSHFDEDVLNKHFAVLCNVLHFLTKDSFRLPDQEKEVRERRTYASSEMMDAAKLLLEAPENIKKYYKNIEFSGKGGFGRVFAAKDITTKKRVAIKKLPHGSDKDKKNNYCEIAFLSTCNHPNIVKFIKAWEFPDKQEAWIVTEFLEGGTLSEAVKYHQFNERHIAYVAREILKALKYLHAYGYIHRDLKSGNVMMSIEGQIKLIDFGLCCDTRDGDRLQMLGSPYWIPPEMIKKKRHGCPADIWSFAVCVLEMYLKEPPNCDSRLYAMFTAASSGLKTAIPARASDHARDFLSKCLEINPKKRWTADQLLEHPFVTAPKLEEGIKDVLRGVFVSNSLALSGI